MRKRILAILLAMVMVLQLTACGGGESGENSSQQTPESSAVEPASEPTEEPPPIPEPTEEPTPQPEAESITVTDQAGREVTLEKPAEKIVSCYYLATASLLTLGQKGKVVGVEMKADSRPLYALAAPEFLELPGVGSGKETNIEAIAALEPDLVLLSAKQKDAADTLTELGIPTALVEPETYDLFNGLIEMLGKLCGCEDEAGELICYYDSMVEKVTGLTADVEIRPQVYLCGSGSYLRSCAGGMYQRQMIDMAGGACVSAELEGSKWLDVSAEQLAAWDPEIIFAVSYAEYTLDDIRSDPALAGVKAIAEDKLYTVPSEIEAWDYPQPSSILGLLWMTHVLHPELVSYEEYVDEAKNFYRIYFNIDLTDEQMGIA